MSEANNFLGLLGEWRSLAELEGGGIQNGDWAKVARCQERKTQLQEIITASRRAGGDRLAGESIENEFRELIALETRNSEWLSQRRQSMIAQKSRVQSAFGNLRKVRSAYGAPRPDAIWNSYS